MPVKKLIYLTLGLLGLGIGAVGAVLPMLPSFPFLLLAAFCFGKSSERLHTWFIGTKLYKENLESYVQGRGMTRATKLRIVGTVTALMAVGFLVMFLRALYIPCGILAAVWVFHLVYFGFGVRTISEDAAQAETAGTEAGTEA